MFAGVGDEPAPTIATTMAETAKTDAATQATADQLENAMKAGKQGVITQEAFDIQKAAGALMSGWGLFWIAGLYFFVYRPMTKS